MAEAFRYRPLRGGQVIGALEPGERQLLDALLQDVFTLLDPESEPGAQDPLVALTGYMPAASAPADPAVMALLPSASEDTGSAEEFRRLSEYSVRQHKRADLQAAQAVLQGRRIEMDLSQAQAMARALNSLALVLAARLGIETDEDAARWAEVDEPVDDESYMALVYTFVTWLRGTLSAALIDSLENGLEPAETEDRQA